MMSGEVIYCLSEGIYSCTKILATGLADAKKVQEAHPHLFKDFDDEAKTVQKDLEARATAQKEHEVGCGPLLSRSEVMP